MSFATYFVKKHPVLLILVKQPTSLHESIKNKDTAPISSQRKEGLCCIVSGNVHWHNWPSALYREEHTPYLVADLDQLLEGNSVSMIPIPTVHNV